MRKLLDPDHAQLAVVLDSLLEEGVDVTAREVARRHPTLKNASAFTRDARRAQIIEQARGRQVDARRVSVAPLLAKEERLSKALEEKEAILKVTESQVQGLVAAHAGLIRAVQLAGGMGALERFWKEYKTVADTLDATGGRPSKAQVVQLPVRG